MVNFIWENIFRRELEKNDLASFLRQNYLFQDLSKKELKVLESLVHRRQYQAGEPVFKQDEIGVGMYLVWTGAVDIHVRDTNPETKDRMLFITRLTKDDFFGELSLVEENSRRSATAICHTESVLIGFFRPDLLDLLKRNPGAGSKIVFRLSEVLGRRLKETTLKIAELRRELRALQDSPLEG